MTDTLATKQDLADLRAHMDAGFREIATRMEAGGRATYGQDLRQLECRTEAGLVTAQRDVLPTSSRFSGEIHGIHDPSVRITPDYFGIDLAFERFDRMLDLRLQLFEWRLTARLGAIMAGGIFLVVLVDRLF